MPPEVTEDARRFADKHANFQGCALIDLRFLTFPNDQSSHVDEKNVSRLVQVFELEGCLRCEVEHHIPAIISKQDLRRGLERSSLSRRDLYSPSPPRLDFPKSTQIRCLHGRHRVEAAKRHLMPGQKFWTIDLFLDTLDGATQAYIGDDYANSRNFCDGDIFRQIRLCQSQNDSRGEGRWQARLSEYKRKYLKQFQTRRELRDLTRAFDLLLPFTGMWPALQIGNFHRLLNLKCPEVWTLIRLREPADPLFAQELEHYIRHILRCWDFILDVDCDKALVDYQTVKRVEMCNPRLSKADADMLCIGMDKGELFPLIADRDRRTRILERLQTIDYTIPSLFTFFEDTKWLEPCALAMRDLLDKPHRGSIRRSFFTRFVGRDLETGFARVLTSDFKYHNLHASEAEVIEYSYHQVWLFAWRHFPELSAIVPRKDLGRPKPQAQGSNHHCWCRFAQFAEDLGFVTQSITEILQRDSDVCMIKQFLRNIRPPAFYNVSDKHCEFPIKYILRVLQRIGEKGPTASLADVQSDVPKSSRCGRPYEKSHEYTKALFYPDQIERRDLQSVSYLSVNRDIFNAFFGRLSIFAESFWSSYEGSDVPKENQDCTVENTTQTNVDPAPHGSCEDQMPPDENDLIPDSPRGSDRMPIDNTSPAPQSPHEKDSMPVDEVDLVPDSPHVSDSMPIENADQAPKRPYDNDSMPVDSTRPTPDNSHNDDSMPIDSTGPPSHITHNDERMTTNESVDAGLVHTTVASSNAVVPYVPHVSTTSNTIVPYVHDSTALSSAITLYTQHTHKVRHGDSPQPGAGQLDNSAKRNEKSPQRQASLRLCGPTEPSTKDTEKSVVDLYHEWESKCRAGELFFVCLPKLTFFHCRSGADFLRSNFFMRYNKSFYFATYISPEEGLKCVDTRHLSRYTRSSKYDGVIFAFLRSRKFKDEAEIYFTQVRGKTTEERFDFLQKHSLQSLRRKRETPDSHPFEVSIRKANPPRPTKRRRGSTPPAQEETAFTVNQITFDFREEDSTDLSQMRRFEGFVEEEEDLDL